MMLYKSLRRIKNLVFKQNPPRISFDPMWPLDCEISEIEARGLPSKVEKALVDIKENGVVVMPATPVAKTVTPLFATSPTTSQIPMKRSNIV